MRTRPVSQYSIETVGIAVYEKGALRDSDTQPLVTIKRVEDGAILVEQAPSTHDDLGLYSYDVTTDVTQSKGDYTVTWTYQLLGQARTYQEMFRVTDPMPFWDALTEDQRAMVVDIYFKVADSFDSTEGGPYLWELPQAGFNAYETIARLMTTDALAFINLSYQPVFVPGYQVGTAAIKPFPTDWYGLLEKATYVEFLKHLSRSYIEQPVPAGVATARFDRRDYRDRWKEEYLEEKSLLEHMIRMFKRKFLVGSRRSMLVAGGLVPRMYINPARPSWQYSIARPGGMF